MRMKTLLARPSDTYTVTSADVAHKIKVRVRFTDDAGNDEFTTSEATGLVNTAATGKPVIDGTARIGLTLTAQTSSIADADRTGRRHVRLPVGPA